MMDIVFKSTVLLVDGSADRAHALAQLLEQHYQVLPAGTGAQALRAAQQSPPPDLVLLAMALPDMDGMRVLNELKRQVLSADIPVLVLTTSQADAELALGAGAADIVRHDEAGLAVLARVASHTELRAARGMLKDRQRHLEQLMVERLREATELQDATIIAMASLAESRDADTGNHIRRTQHYVAALARELRFASRYMGELTNENIALLFKAAPLHDIGKVGVPDAILLKSGKLSAAEFEQMKLHTVYGRDAIIGVEQTLGGSNQFLRYAKEIAYSHQEHFDGSGYPQGLAGQAIPLSARLMAVADVYDALISERPYRPAFTHETAVELIRQGRGDHFDPDIVDAMLAVEATFKNIATQFRAGQESTVASQRQL